MKRTVLLTIILISFSPLGSHAEEPPSKSWSVPLDGKESDDPNFDFEMLVAHGNATTRYAAHLDCIEDAALRALPTWESRLAAIFSAGRGRLLEIVLVEDPSGRLDSIEFFINLPVPDGPPWARELELLSEDELASLTLPSCACKGVREWLGPQGFGFDRAPRLLDRCPSPKPTPS